MQQMIDAIAAAVAKDATPEQRAAGAQACRTILAALEAETGKAIALPGAPAPSPLAGIAPEQALDLLIARLRALVPAEGSAAPAGAPERPGPGLRIAMVQAPPRNGLRPVTRPVPRRKP